jgi:glycosyltransferase involved in cell wall biosynthesis
VVLASARTKSFRPKEGLGRLRRLTVVVPAYNEEQKLAKTVREILEAANRELDDFEVIVVNDGSTDATGAVANSLAREHPQVSVAHQPANRGVGAAYYLGLTRARYPALTVIPGDNAFHFSGVEALFRSVGSAELVVSYRDNMQARTPLRRFLSVCCTATMRWLTGRPIRDAHSMFVFPVEQARQIPVNDGYGYHIEALSSLLQTCRSYAEVPVRLNPRPDASSGVMRPRVIASLVWTMARMYCRRFLGRRSRRRAAETPGHTPATALR